LPKHPAATINAVTFARAYPAPSKNTFAVLPAWRGAVNAATTTPTSIAAPINRLSNTSSFSPGPTSQPRGISSSRRCGGIAVRKSNNRGMRGTKALKRLTRNASSISLAGSSRRQLASARAHSSQKSGTVTHRCTSNKGQTCSTHAIEEVSHSRLTVRNSGAPGLSNSPPMLAPSASAAPIVVGDRPAVASTGTRTLPTATAVLDWLMIGTLTIVPMRTMPGISNVRTR
jgi:hypothetical protein